MTRAGAALRLAVLATPALVAALAAPASTAAASPSAPTPARAVVQSTPQVGAQPPTPAPSASPSIGPSPVPTPTSPATPGTPGTKGASTGSILSNPIGIVVLLGALTIVPAALMTMTAFTRIVIVLGFTRNALSTQSVPPNQVIIGLSMFLTLFVMGPTFAAINTDAVQPYLHGQINASQAYDKGIEPLREFMLKQVRAKDLSLFTDMSGKPAPTSPDQVPTTTLIPAFVLSELHQAFIIGFVVFLPFLIIDLIVAAALSSLGMMMLPPVLVSLPFKLLLFVAVDGWYLVVGSLMRSFH